MFIVFSAAQFEDAGDMVVAGAVMNTDGKWERTQVVVDQFEMDRETWLPWCPTVLLADDGVLHVFFMANKRSNYVFVNQPRSVVRSGWQMSDDNRNKMLTPHPPGHLEMAARNQISYQLAYLLLSPGQREKVLTVATPSFWARRMDLCWTSR